MTGNSNTWWIWWAVQGDRNLMVSPLTLGSVLLTLVMPWPALAQCDPVQDRKLLADDGTEGDMFGHSVAIHGDFAVIGAVGHRHERTTIGSAYFFNATTGQLIAEVVPEDDFAAQLFGWSVAIHGDTAVIGAIYDNENGVWSGAAYVFRYDGSSWVQEAKLLPEDGAPRDQAGASVAMHGDLALVGTRGSREDDFIGRAYVFRRDGSTWAQEAKLMAEDGAPGDQFGLSVAISGDTAIIGANQDDDNGTDSGSAYVFRHDGSSWVQTAKLLPEDGASGDAFGISVAIDGLTALIGAKWDGDNGWSAGSSYVFDAATGDELAKLLADDGARRDGFGHDVAIHGETAVIAAPTDDDNGFFSGSAYVFHNDGSQWSQQAKVLASDGAPSDRFGWSVGIHGGRAVIGAIGDDDDGDNSGSAYLFRLCNCPDEGDCDDSVDCTDDACVDGLCAFVPNDALCDDDVFCNGAERCMDGGCAPGSDPCPPEQACDEETDSCLERVGACCVDGGCLPDLDERFCEDDLGGAYVGDFVECGGDVCDPGACCLPTGECFDIPGPACDNAGGAFEGVGTDCGSTSCPQPVGACCIDRVCEPDLEERDCAKAGGEWAGPFTECDQDLCRRGACCFDGGSCEDMHPTECQDAGGLFAGDETDCATWTCTEACCREGGACEDIAPSICEADGGISGGLGSTCAQSQCLGVCCINTICVPGQEEDNCLGAGGRWAGPFTDCEDDPDICGGCIRDPEWACDGDVDGNGQVNPVDAGLVQASYGSADEQDLCNYDMDCDGQINPVDSGIVQSLLGTCEPVRGICP